MDKLELLALAKDFSVTKTDGGYEVEANDSSLSAFINNNNKIKYYVNGCYNSGCDWLEIDIEALEKLKTFCELMMK